VIDDFLHISITCRDLETTIRFYEAIGLKAIKRLGIVDDPGIAQAFQLPGERLDVAYLATTDKPGALFIDLVQWLDPVAKGVAYPSLDHIGLNRFALRVPDLDATVASARGQGVTFMTDAPVAVGDDGMRFIVARDPDGVFVQLVEGF
jgi:catechol 2,3-dioxygenase-like lactoylglutathione lyase family enzyme